MHSGYKKRRKDLVKFIERKCPGFEVLSLDEKRKHLCMTIRDDARNVFKVFTACSGAPSALRNVIQDVRRQSNRAKGICD